MPQLSPSLPSRLEPQATSLSHPLSPHHKRTGLATEPSVAPGRYHLLLAMTRLLPLVLAKPGLKTTMACPVHERLPSDDPSLEAMCSIRELRVLIHERSQVSFVEKRIQDNPRSLLSRATPYRFDEIIDGSNSQPCLCKHLRRISSTVFFLIIHNNRDRRGYTRVMHCQRLARCGDRFPSRT